MKSRVIALGRSFNHDSSPCFRCEALHTSLVLKFAYGKNGSRSTISNLIVLLMAHCIDLDGLRVGRPGFESQQGQDFLFSTTSKPALAPIMHPTEWVPGAPSPGGKVARREADHSPQSSAEVKNGGAIPPLPHMSSWHST
jgi:hypothetical protein